MIEKIARFTDSVALKIAEATKGFVATRAGKIFLGLSLVGPVTFLPTVWEAWTASNIDALRTLTWPLMAVVNIAVLVSVCHNGVWHLRLCMAIWVVLMLLIWAATLVR